MACCTQTGTSCHVMWLCHSCAYGREGYAAGMQQLLGLLHLSQYRLSSMHPSCSPLIGKGCTAFVELPSTSAQNKIHLIAHKQADVSSMQGMQGVIGTWASSPKSHHLISQNAIDSVIIQVDQPVQPLHLVLAHLSVLDDRWLCHKPVTRPLSSCNFILYERLVLHFLGVFRAMSTPASATPETSAITAAELRQLCYSCYCDA